MDYQFYLKELFVLDSVVYQNLRDFAMNLEIGANPSYTLQPDSGYFSRRKTVAEPIDLEVDAIVNSMPFFDRNQLCYYEFNKLSAGKIFHEHTDVFNKTNNGHRVTKTHNLHIPLLGNARYFFRRDRRYDLEEEGMDHGKVYMFNNYVYHKIVNDGEEDRINLLLSYWDAEWISKTKIYQHFGLAKGI